MKVNLELVLVVEVLVAEGAVGVLEDNVTVVVEVSVVDVLAEIVVVV